MCLVLKIENKKMKNEWKFLNEEKWMAFARQSKHIKYLV